MCPPLQLPPGGQPQRPPEHAAFVIQNDPQAPQLLGSVCRFLQTPLQQVSPEAQPWPHAPQLRGSECVAVQTPAQQFGLRNGQTMPQPPQLLGSLWKMAGSMHWSWQHEVLAAGFPGRGQQPLGQQSVSGQHWPTQSTVPSGQTQCKLRHTMSGRQTCPQDPQLTGSMSVSAQMPAQQWTKGGPLGGEQTMPQAPQLSLSYFVSTQCPPQHWMRGAVPLQQHSGPVGSVRPPGCVPALQTQTPLSQCRPIAQALPQAPQCLSLVIRSTQWKRGTLTVLGVRQHVSRPAHFRAWAQNPQCCGEGPGSQ